MKVLISAFTLALAAVITAWTAPNQKLTGSVSRSPINIGQTAVVTFTGGQLDVAGGNIIDDIGSEFANSVELKKLDRNRFQVKGIAPCDCALKFTDGKNQTTVRLKVLKK